MADFIPMPSSGYDNRANDQRRNFGGRGGGRGGRGWGRGGRGRGRGHGGRGRQGRGRGRDERGRPENDFVEIGTPTEKSLCIAVEGCCHGELDAIYDRIRLYNEKHERKVDLLLICGDFQSLRNTRDYNSYAAPPKYRKLGVFHRYYSGEIAAPVLTVFVGGNHEASQPLQELYYGGWVAPNIYYMGAAGVVDFAGLRIGGISGIYKKHHYNLGRFEKPPYDSNTVRSIYHVRSIDVYRLKCLQFEQKRLDIMVSHDWPQGIEQHGNTGWLLSQKPFFRDEIQRNCLGSPANLELLNALRPRKWFAAHLHVCFRATVRHVPVERSVPSGSMDLIPSQVTHQAFCKPVAKKSSEGEPDSEIEVAPGQDQNDISTEFLSLDKCLPRRKCLSFVHVPVDDCSDHRARLKYDLEWLALLRKTHHLTATENRKQQAPAEHLLVGAEDITWVRQRLEGRNGDLFIPFNFKMTVPPPNDPSCVSLPDPLPMMGNPQTDELLDIIGLDHIVTIPFTPSLKNEVTSINQVINDANEIDIDDGSSANSVDDDNPDVSSLKDKRANIDDKEDNAPTSSEEKTLKIAANPVIVATTDVNEIDIDEGSACSADKMQKASTGAGDQGKTSSNNEAGIESAQDKADSSSIGRIEIGSSTQKNVNKIADRDEKLEAEQAKKPRID